MKLLLKLATITSVVLTLGCGGQEDASSTLAPSMAAGGSGGQTPRLRLTWADSVNVGSEAAPSWVPAGYRGDGRLRDGTPGDVSLSNEYQGDWCGVNAVVGRGVQGESFQATFDPDQWWTATLPPSCHPARAVLIYLNGPEQAPGITRQHQYFPALGAMTAGQTLIMPWQNGTGAELGVNLWFDNAYPPASSTRWTRLPNMLDGLGRSVRQWRVETQGTHRAMGAAQICNSKGKCSLGPTGTTYYLPFVLTITEVLP